MEVVGWRQWGGDSGGGAIGGVGVGVEAVGGGGGSGVEAVGGETVGGWIQWGKQSGEWGGGGSGGGVEVLGWRQWGEAVGVVAVGLGWRQWGVAVGLGWRQWGEAVGGGSGVGVMRIREICVGMLVPINWWTWD